jgi:hypothetical protein
LITSSIPPTYHPVNAQSPSDTRKNEKTAADETAWQTEPLQNHASRERSEEWEFARTYRKLCEHYPPAKAASLYLSDFSAFPPDRFYTSTAKRKAAAKKALSPTGWATRLLKQLNYPNTPVYFYSLHMGHLGLPVAYSASASIYSATVIEEIKAAIEKHVPKPYYWKLEVGLEGAAHVHLIAHASNSLDYLLFEGSEVIKPLIPGRETGLFRYLSKPAAPFTELLYADYLQAKQDKQTGNLPTLSGQPGLARKKRAKKGENEKAITISTVQKEPCTQPMERWKIY